MSLLHCYLALLCPSDQAGACKHAPIGGPKHSSVVCDAVVFIPARLLLEQMHEWLLHARRVRPWNARCLLGLRAVLLDQA
eukprot:478463-Alexandrium_andersonii.AAC.1